jgi:general secretion pathway protein A
MEKKLLALFGLQFDPFSPGVPVHALHVAAPLEEFSWRVERLAGEGGFALISGDPGTGKSAALRVMAERLEKLGDVQVAHLTRPQASVADFYRELGHLFGVALSPHNRWAGAQALRDKWLAHIGTSLSRPVLIADEAQEMNPALLSELRLLSSTRLDSQAILTVVLAGDSRLVARLDTPELLPIASRIRVRLRTDYLPPDQLRAHLVHLVGEAGCPQLMTEPLLQTLCEHAAGNLRTMTNMAAELLGVAVRRQLDRLDEQLFLQTFAPARQPSRKKRP